MYLIRNQEFWRDLEHAYFTPVSALGPDSDEAPAESEVCSGAAVRALVRFGHRLVCSGSTDGTLRIWPRSYRPADNVLHRPSIVYSAGDGAAVLCLAQWQGLLISGHDDGALRAWEPATGRCARRRPAAHDDSIYTLARCPGGRLASASYDRAIKIWAANRRCRDGGAGWWACERVLAGHRCLITALAVLPGGRGGAGTLFSASLDRTVRAWRLADGAPRAAPAGHAAAVYALALVSAATRARA